jgi:ribose/xylose/arabinose/galactoside ABC-type transport system permease subunit
MTEEDAVQTDAPQSFYDDWKWRLSSKAIWIGLVFLLLVLALLATMPVMGFWKAAGLRNLARAWLLFPALLVPAMILVVASGGIDLSVGAVAGVVAVVMASLMTSEISVGPAVALLVGMLLAIFIGLVNGLVVGLARLHGAVATFGMMVLLRGVVLVVTDGYTIPVGEVGFLGSLAVPGLVLALLLTLGVIVLTELAPFARQRFLGLRDGGSWLQRLALAGLPYVLSSALAGFAGACYVGITQYGTIMTGVGLEAEVILIVFLGGTALGGGLVNGVGAILAALTFAVVRNILALSSQPPGRVEIIRGVGLVVFGLLCQLYYMIVGWIFKRVKSKKAPVADMHE